MRELRSLTEITPDEGAGQGLYAPMTCHERHQQQFSDRSHAVDAVLAQLSRRIDRLEMQLARWEADD